MLAAVGTLHHHYLRQKTALNKTLDRSTVTAFTSLAKDACIKGINLSVFQACEAVYIGASLCRVSNLQLCYSSVRQMNG